MHACGNPLHDVPIWIVMAIPALAPAFIWGRAIWHRVRASVRRA